MNLSKYTAQLFVEVKTWVEELLLKERDLTETKLVELADKINRAAEENAQRDDAAMQLIDQLRDSQKALDVKQDLCADAIKTLETADHEPMQKWADDLIAPVEKARQEFGDLSEQINGIDGDVASRLDEFETKMIEHTLAYEEKFVADYIACLSAELLEEGEALQVSNG